MEKRFGVLRTIATIFKIVAWVVLVITIIGFFVALLGSSLFGRGGIASSFLVLIIGVIYFLSLYAFAELIYLFLSIEENVRLIASKSDSSKPEERREQQ